MINGEKKYEMLVCSVPSEEEIPAPKLFPPSKRGRFRKRGGEASTKKLGSLGGIKRFSIIPTVNPIELYYVPSYSDENNKSVSHKRLVPIHPRQDISSIMSNSYFFSSLDYHNEGVTDF